MSPRRRTRTTWICLTVLAAGVLSALWVLAGRADTAGERLATADPPDTSLITVDVTNGRIVERQQMVCHVRAVSRRTIPIGVSETMADLAVVTALPSSGTIEDGSVLIEVSGRPVIAVQGPLAAYRDIYGGDQGPDVTQLHEFLNRQGYLAWAHVLGPVGHATLDAVSDLYRDLGYLPPWGNTSIPHAQQAAEHDRGTAGRENPADEEDAALDNARGAEEETPDYSEIIAWPRTEHAVVDSPAGLRTDYTGLSIGSVLEPGELDLVSTSVGVACPTDLLAPSVMRRGRALLADGGGRWLRLKVVSATRKQVIYQPKSGSLARGLEHGAEQIVDIVTHRSPRGLIVPVSAVWTDAQGRSHVTLQDGADVAATVVDSAAGMALVEATKAEALAAGQAVRVSGTGGG